VTVTIGTSVIVYRFALDGITGVQGVASGPVRARADRDVTSRRARGARAALATGARVPARKVDARSIIRALVVGETLAALTARQGIADVTGGARAHRSLLAGIVVTRGANCIRSAGIRFAEVT